MIACDRRSALIAAALGTAVAAIPGALAATAPRAPVLFLYDARFATARAEALAWNQHGVRVLDVRSRDLGVAWREEIAPLLRQTGGALKGRTLGSDRMISAIFARELGRTLSDETADAGDCETRAWSIV